MTRKQKVNASPLVGVVLRALAIASLVAVTMTGCQSQQDDGQEGEEEVAMGKIFNCIAVRTRSVINAQCVRSEIVIVNPGEPNEREVEMFRDCQVGPPNCVRNETIRRTLCIGTCPPDDPVSVCDPVKDNLTESCADMTNALNDCMNQWEIDCRAARQPGVFGAGDCVPTYTVATCNTVARPDNVPEQCAEDCEL